MREDDIITTKITERGREENKAGGKVRITNYNALTILTT